MRTRPDVSDCWDLFWVAQILTQLHQEKVLNKKEYENLYYNLNVEERREFFNNPHLD